MGPLRDQDFDVLVASFESLGSSKKINEFRVLEGRKSIDICVIDLIGNTNGDEKNFSEKTSSSTVRNYLLEKNRLTCDEFVELSQ